MTMTPMRGVLPFLAAFLIALPARGALFEHDADDLAAEVRAAAREGKLLAVLFEQRDCDHCRALRAEVLAHGEAEAFARRYRTVKVAIDRAEAIKTPQGDSLPRWQWAGKLGVVATPAFIFFDGGGIVYRHLGTLSSPGELILLGRFIHERAYEEAPWAAYRDANDKPR
ncbi:MAG: thioredoxin fold domain-containing protein [Azoarcus sp.]|jgi:thioredoxin-related protein|nr:thioredoxin fold domain-containing protein [Azoarcus sp.]